jgi:hypothetical protein
MSLRGHVRWFSPLVIGVVMLAFGITGHASAPNRGYVRTKSLPVISPWSQSVISATTTNGRVKVWVLFTDKGFADDRGFRAAAAAQSVALTPAAGARRAKMGRSDIGFVDIPVQSAYVDRLRDFGATVRHTSRWLNAASVEIDASQLDQLSSQPFVHEIRPMIGFKRIYETPENITNTAVGQQKSPSPAGISDVLNYGPSLAQLTQIDVPAAHTAGYRGQGVIVCMMDTGFRKDHIVFAHAYAEGHVLAEHDFIFNDGNTFDSVGVDAPGQMSHGTLTWSTLGGAFDGQHYGPAFESQFVLAKTEDTRSETPIEEDNWVAGMEWADSIGASVISSSLAYSDWYTYANYNGDYCVTTKAADSACVLGIIVCNAMGNSGPGAGTLAAPADADSILSCGAVDMNGTIAGFSSRGPTADGRTKPEVCARGVSTTCATYNSTSSWGSASGTSLSTPLIGGASAVVLSAHPTWTPMQVREALMQTASLHCTPGNTYGWGIIDVMAAINYSFCALAATADPPITSNPIPCSNVNYTISWNPASMATAYELYENDSLVFDGAALSQVRSHASGTYSYKVRAKSGCGSCGMSLAGGTTTVNTAPQTPTQLATSQDYPCVSESYEVSWNSVTNATGYELYENNVLVQNGPNTIYNASHASGVYNYYVLATNACGPSAPTPLGATTAINVCPCHGDPMCDGQTDILDVVDVINEAFRGGPTTADPTCRESSRADVDCSCAVDVLDVTKMINVAFRGASKATEFCNPCLLHCP